MSGVDVEGVLAVHWSYETTKDYDGWLCECGARIAGRVTADTDVDMRAHVAAMRAHVAAVLREQIAAAIEQAREMGKADAMGRVLDSKGPIWNRMHGDGWDEGYRAGQDAAAGTYGDGSEAPENPYRAALVAPSRVPGEET